MNIIQILGNLGSDPETRFTPSNLKVTNFNVGTTVRRGGKDETVWYRVTVWGDRFDKMMTYLKKGSSIIVVGELGKPEIYTRKDGTQQVSLEITAEFIRFSPFGKPQEKTGNEAESSESLKNQYTQAAPAQRQETRAGASVNPSFSTSDLDDGLPF